MSALNNPNALKIKSMTFSTGIWKTKTKKNPMEKPRLMGSQGQTVADSLNYRKMEKKQQQGLV